MQNITLISQRQANSGYGIEAGTDEQGVPWLQYAHERHTLEHWEHHITDIVTRNVGAEPHDGRHTTCIRDAIGEARAALETARVSANQQLLEQIGAVDPSSISGSLEGKTLRIDIKLI